MKVGTPHIAMATIGCLAPSGIVMAQVPEITGRLAQRQRAGDAKLRYNGNLGT